MIRREHALHWSVRPRRDGVLNIHCHYCNNETPENSERNVKQMKWFPRTQRAAILNIISSPVPSRFFWYTQTAGRQHNRLTRSSSYRSFWNIPIKFRFLKFCRHICYKHLHPSIPLWLLMYKLIIITSCYHVHTGHPSWNWHCLTKERIFCQKTCLWTKW